MVRKRDREVSALRDMRRHRGLSMEALAQLAGTTASQINKLEKKQRRLTDEWMIKLSRALNCDPADLIDDARRAASSSESQSPEHVILPECDLSAVDQDGPAAGKGHLLDYAVFRIDWLTKLTTGPSEMLMVYQVDDDSMEPTLRPGDHALVELVGDRMRGDGIYVFATKAGLAMKRIVFFPEGERVSVLSDNPLYPAHEAVDRASINLIGRVIWVGRRL